MNRSSVDVLVVGAGPKGLALHLAARLRGMDALLVERREPGHSWRRDFINARTPLTPSISHEITSQHGYRFIDFWASHGARELKNHALSRGLHTAAHFRHYLHWLAGRLDLVQRGWALSRLRWSGREFVASFESNGELIAKSVVLATGLVGVGEQEFMHDPSGLLGRSPLVEHHPGTINSIGEMCRFVGDERRVAIVGGGAACSSAAFQLWAYTNVARILIVSSHPLCPESTIQDGELDYGHVYSSIRKNFLRLIWCDARFQVVESARLVEATLLAAGGLELRLRSAQREWRERTGRLILATGYRYDYRQIPFLRELAPALVPWPCNPRYVALDSRYRARTDKGCIPLFMLGEASAAREVKERWLATTRRTVRRVIATLR
ncbi:MAG: NAD(P)-binding domain-containing protein [Thermoanaerobaculia bacterium]